MRAFDRQTDIDSKVRSNEVTQKSIAVIQTTIECMMDIVESVEVSKKIYTRCLQTYFLTM